MPEAKLFLLPVPDVDRDRYRHDVIHLIATEDLSVLNLLDNDDPAAACEVVRDQLPGYRPQVLVEGGHATGLDCEVTHGDPIGDAHHLPECDRDVAHDDNADRRNHQQAEHGHRESAFHR